MAKNTTKQMGEETEPLKVVRPAHTSLYKDGREFPDPTPMAPPVGFIKQPTLAETMRQMIAGEALRRHAREAGAETFEEADDFEVGEDYDPTSPYEETFEPPPVQISPEEADKALAKHIANELKQALSGDTAGTPAADASPPPGPSSPPGESPEGGGSPPSSNPFTGFFKA